MKLFAQVVGQPTDLAPKVLIDPREFAQLNHQGIVPQLPPSLLSGSAPQELRYHGITDLCGRQSLSRAALRRGLQSPLHGQAGASRKRFRQTGRHRARPDAIEQV
jgi:hypothetical protein